MTAPEFSEHDLDRLADYLGGALDPAEAAEVQHLIDTDPGWAAAYRALAAADAAVANDLQEYARGRIEPMPADVIARLDQALDSPLRSGDVVSLERRRRRFVWPAIAGAAAAIVAVFFGLNSLIGHTTSADYNTIPERNTAQGSGGGALSADSGGGAAGPGVAPVVPASGPPVLTASGKNYTAETLGTVLVTLSAATASPTGKSEQPYGGFTIRDAPVGLARLTQSSALESCLQSVRAAHPGTVQAVDFARYDGRPALILRLHAVPDLAVAVGPDCGLGGPNELAVKTTGR